LAPNTEAGDIFNNTTANQLKSQAQVASKKSRIQNLMRIRKDSLIPEKVKNAGFKLFEVIRCKKPEIGEVR
jgi:hypothetical protein